MEIDAEKVGQAGRQGDADDVVDECPEEILPNHVHRAATQIHCFRQCAEVIGQESDLRHVHGHVRSMPYGDAYVGKGEGLCVVDAVANHCHGPALALQLAHEVFLVLWQCATMVVGDARFRGPVLCCLILVAAHHIDLDALLVEQFHRFTGVRLELLAVFRWQLVGFGEVDVLAGNG